MAHTDESKSLEKYKPSLASQAEIYDAMDKAFDYRGDVTLTLKDGTQMVGYVFNRETGKGEPFVELFPANKDEKVKVFYKDIADLFFSGIDTAAGRSWAAWVAKYKAKEEAASTSAGSPT